MVVLKTNLRNGIFLKLFLFVSYTVLMPNNGPLNAHLEAILQLSTHSGRCRNKILENEVLLSISSLQTQTYLWLSLVSAKTSDSQKYICISQLNGMDPVCSVWARWNCSCKEYIDSVILLYNPFELQQKKNIFFLLFKYKCNKHQIVIDLFQMLQEILKSLARYMFSYHKEVIRFHNYYCVCSQIHVR